MKLRKLSTPGSTAMKLYFVVSYCCYLVGLTAALRTSSPRTLDETQYDSSDIITRDICIIGGGSSGTYAAIRLRDMGKSVVVVERKAVLGGHTNTYTVPGTDIKIDYGVVFFHDLDIVHKYFDRFNISLVKISFPPSNNEYVDFQTGMPVANYTPPNPSSIVIYTAQLAKYSYVEGGFDLEYPVPEDLLLPFGDFVKKYGVGDIVPLLFDYLQGVGDLLHQPTLYILKGFGSDLIRGLTIGYLTTANHDNHEIYDKAAAELGYDALLSSYVLDVDRPSSGPIKVLVSTPSGQKVIKASKLLLTIPPKLHQLKHFDLDDTERELFAQFGNSAYYTGLVTNTGIPDNVSLYNTGLSTPYHIAHLPGFYAISPTGVPGLLDVKYGSAYPIPEDEVKSNIVTTIARLSNAGLPTTNQTSFVAYNSHTPFELTVSPDAIKDGFYRRLYALQGRRNTWWTGAAWHTYDSSLLWNFTETHVLPGIMA